MHVDLRRPDRRARLGDPRQLRPLRSDAGPLLVPLDRAAIDLVWHTSGYPSHGAYRDTTASPTRRHHAVGERRRALRPGARRRAGPRARRATSSRASRRAGGRRAVRCARSTPSCSGTAGTRASTGWPRCSRRATRRARAGRRSTTRWARRRRRRRRPSCPARAGASRATSRPGARRRRPSWPGARARPSCACSAAGRPSATAALRELLALQASDWAFADPRDRRRRTRASAPTATPPSSSARSPTGRNRSRRCATWRLRSTADRDFRVSDLTTIARIRGVCAYPCRLHNESRVPAGPVRRGAGDPMEPWSAPGANRRHARRSAGLRASPTANPVGAETQGGPAVPFDRSCEPGPWLAVAQRLAAPRAPRPRGSAPRAGAPAVRGGARAARGA